MADGKDGARGPMGLQGATGATGASGAIGAQGPAGTKGSTGLTGATGATGAKGDKGDTGATGLQGPAGNPGIDGLKGVPGPAGSPGATGADGQDGTPGPKGDVGATGAVGAQGNTGPAGADGSVSFADAFQAEGEPQDVNAISETLGLTDLCDVAAVLMVIPEVYDDGNVYDHTTGIFTVGTTGRYDLSVFTSMSIPLGWSNGRLKVGITDPATCVFYCVNFTEVTGKMDRAQVSASAMGVPLTAGEELAVKIINVGTKNYVTVTGDVVRFNARRIG
jgi:hypothetical protein